MLSGLVNVWGLQLEGAACELPVVSYGRERMRGLGLGLCRWTTSEVCLLDIMRMDRVQNAQIRELWVVVKGVGEGIDKSVV